MQRHCQWSLLCRPPLAALADSCLALVSLLGPAMINVFYVGSSPHLATTLARSPLIPLSSPFRSHHFDFSYLSLSPSYTFRYVFNIDHHLPSLSWPGLSVPWGRSWCSCMRPKAHLTPSCLIDDGASNAGNFHLSITLGT